MGNYRFPYTIISKSGISHGKFDSPAEVTRAEMDALFGDEFIRYNNLVKAQQYFSRGMAKDPQSPANILGMSMVLHWQKQFDKAVRERKRLLELASDNVPVKRRLAFFLADISPEKGTVFTLSLKINLSVDINDFFH